MFKVNTPNLDDAIRDLNLDISCFIEREHPKLRGVDITQEMVDVVKALTKYGCKQIDIAKRFNVQQSMISKMNSGHYPIEDKPIEVPVIAVDTGKIKALYRANWPVSEIALDCNVSEETVRDILRLTNK